MKRLALLLIKFYKLTLSPYMPGQCRYQPTCSDYASQAIETHGALGGSVLTLRRLARCHPGARAGFDPVPEPGKRAAT